MSDPLFNRVALIGIGLIGSSLARVIRREWPRTRIVACARHAETLEAVCRLGIADETTNDPAAAAAGTSLPDLERCFETIDGVRREVPCR